MRPRRLTISAFGPYAETQELDFATLGDRGMFLVTGPTGAGKTTILDAICYALYGDASGSERESKGLRSQYARPDDATRVTLDFTLGERAFRVTRAAAYERVKKRGEGTTEVKGDATLWESNATAPEARSLATGDRKVTDAVVGLLGFASEQFRQIVVLPQGEFRRFLLAEVKEREEILAALFATHVYGRVEQALIEAAKDVAVERRRRRDDIDLVLSQVAAAGAAGTGAAATPIAFAEVAARRDALRVLVIEADRVLVAAREASDAARVALERGRLVDGLARDHAAARDAHEAAARALAERRVGHDEAVRALETEKARDVDREARREEERRLRELGKRGAALESAAREVALAERAAEAVLAARVRADGAVGDAEAATETARDAETRVVALAAELDAREQALARAEDHATKRTAIEALRKAYRSAEAAAKKAKDAREDAASRLAKAQAGLAELEQEWEAGQAFLLAKTLKEGSPCPVCGATHHPGKRRARAEPPPHKRLEAKREDVKKAERAVEEAAATVAVHDGEMKRAIGAGKELEKALGALAKRPSEELDAAVETARAARDAAREATARVADARARVVEAQRVRARRGEEQLAAVGAEKKAAADAAAARERLAERSAEVPEELRGDGAIARAQERVAEQLRALELALATAQERAARADRELADAIARADAARTHAEEAGRRHDAAAAGRADVAALEAAWHEADTAREAAAQHRAERDAAVRQHDAWIAQLDELESQRTTLDGRYQVVGKLAEVARGENPFNLNFQRFVLASLLDDVLSAASVRLATLTRGRYRLQRPATLSDRRKSGGLALEVHDEYTGTARGAATLSGGESFLASLALALGLADVVERYAGGVHLDTLFVDEGFGALDPEALEQAVTALEALRTEGRLVGVISHVPELRGRFLDARLEVTKDVRGSTARFVVG